jgi:crossover junction endodeoxyribonuclease RuvC
MSMRPTAWEVPMRVLGIDPGLTRCGVGVIEGQPARPPRLVAVDVIRTDHDGEISLRLLTIAEAVEAAISRYQPDVIALERVFSQRNVRTVMGTAQVSGVVILAAARAAIPVVLHTPTEVKAAITGSGRADKAQVAAMVTRLLKLSAAPKPADAADALALAICQLWRGGAQAKLASALALARYPMEAVR